MEFNHIPVLFNETIEALNIKPDGIYVDGTVGGAGHSKEIASRLKSGHLIAMDWDPDALEVAAERLKGLPVTLVNSNFRDMDIALDNLGIELVDGILLDLGVSSHQLDCAERGFSFHKAAPLDMRMSQSGATAADLVNTASQDELNRILREYGEEKFSYKIAAAIIKARQLKPVETTDELSDIISSAVPAAYRREGHPARKTFQALRIAVNGELESLSLVLDKAFNRLNKGGVLAIITFHSLEDRMVKQKFKSYTAGCTCPPDFPVCVCGKTPQGKLIKGKGVTASAEELALNPRSRSAKLRAIVKL